jgi:hypothetical protein
VSCGPEQGWWHRLVCVEFVSRLPCLNASRNRKSQKDYRHAEEKANLISQTGLYLIPATAGFYPEVKAEGLPHTFACSTIGPAGLNLRRLEGVSARSLRAGAFCRNPERSSRRIL